MEQAKASVVVPVVTPSVVDEVIQVIPPDIPMVVEQPDTVKDSNKWASVLAGARSTVKSSAGKTGGLFNKLRDDFADGEAIVETDDIDTDEPPIRRTHKLRQYPTLNALSSIAAITGMLIVIVAIVIGVQRINTNDPGIGIPIIIVGVLLALIPLLFAEVIKLFINVAADIETIVKRDND